MACKNQVLIVESARNNLSDVIRDLTKAGIDADLKVALNGGHALLHVKQLHLSTKIEDLNLLIILNLLTPIANGFEFLKEYSEDNSLRKEKIKIAVLSDNLTPHQIEDAELLGVQHFISTPITFNQLNNFASEFFHQTSLEPDSEENKKRSEKINRKKQIKKKPEQGPTHPSQA